MDLLHRMTKQPLRAVAATLISSRVKSYKKRLKDHNCWKNIRSTPSDAHEYENLFASRKRPAHVRLSNGQVVATDDFETHMQRKVNRIRVPATIRPPKRFYVMESAYFHGYQFWVSLSYTYGHHMWALLIFAGFKARLFRRPSHVGSSY